MISDQLQVWTTCPSLVWALQPNGPDPPHEGVVRCLPAPPPPSAGGVVVVVVTGGAVVVVVGAGAGGTVELVVRLPSDAVVEPLLGVRSTTVAALLWFDLIPDEPVLEWLGCVVVEVAGAGAPALAPPGAAPPDDEDPSVDGLVKVGMVVGPLAPCTLRVGGLAAPVANKVATNKAAAATLTVAIIRLRISATREAWRPFRSRRLHQHPAREVVRKSPK